MPTRRFTKTELSRYDGKNGARAYIAYKGRVYDVSHSFLWQNGKHQVLHVAGTDMTGDFKQAPHAEDVLDKFPVVGILSDD